MSSVPPTATKVGEEIQICAGGIKDRNEAVVGAFWSTVRSRRWDGHIPRQNRPDHVSVSSSIERDTMSALPAVSTKESRILERIAGSVQLGDIGVSCAAA